jgi:uncharacterized protein (TIGR02145 family)
MSKNKAWIQYTKYGEIVPGSLIVSPRRPVNGVWYEVVTDICCDTEPPFGLISSKQKAFVKYDASGNIVPGSLVLTDGRLPKPGIWKEVYIDICCSTTSTTTTTTSCQNIVPEPIIIGTQTWSLYNLDVTTYRNCDPIPQVTDPTEWINLTTGAWCYYNNDPANGAIYGKLYNYYAITDPRGLAPVGWHVSSKAEWDTLQIFLGPATAGGALKETGTTHWNAPNTGATNSTGFTALGGGFRFAATGGNFVTLKTYGAFWTTTTIPPSSKEVVRLDFNSAAFGGFAADLADGCSIRLVKD